MKPNDTNHTANFLASYFLSSNISQNKIYKLKTHHIAIIRYICDSIDKNFTRRKKFHTKIYQSQIAKFTFLSRKTINKELQHLIKKRIIKRTDKNTFTIGKVLIACNLRLQRKEVLPTVTQVRSVTHSYTSNSSNITNRGKSYPQAENYKPCKTAEKASSYLEEFMKKTIN